MKTHEVKNVIPSGVVLRQTLPRAFTLHVEVREKQNGTWRVYYPDPGWIPCEPVCHLKHKHDYEQNWIESHYKPEDYEDALNWAEAISEGREVKVVTFVPLRERNRGKKKT